MTREEALEFIAQSVKSDVDMALVADALKALEQEPCGDAISRQAVIDMTGLSDWFDSSDSYNEFVFALSELPSVNPTSNVSIQITEREKYGRFN